MKKLLLAVVLVLAMAIPTFAQNGPVKIKLLMAYAENDAHQATPIFSIGIGEYIISRTHWEVKGTGSFMEKLEVRDSAGGLVFKSRSGNFDVNSSTFASWDGSMYIPIGVIPRAGYYTLKSIYRDLETGNTWSQQTKIHVFAP